jgi:hypothetical protein
LKQSAALLESFIASLSPEAVVKYHGLAHRYRRPVEGL